MAYFIFVISLMVIYVALATLLHIQFGVTGIVNFGVVGFWGLGMYSATVLQVQYGIPLIVAVILATLLVGVIAFGLGWLILDLEPQAILVATLAFATIVMHLVTTEKWLTNGVVGIGVVPFPLDIGRRSDLLFLLFLILVTGAIIWYGLRLRSMPYGRLLHSIQDNETLARGLGKDTVRQKLVLFGVTSMLMGFLGTMSASLNHFLTPQLLVPSVTFTVWIALILGGKHRVWGALLGVMMTVGLFDLLIETYAPFPRALAQELPNLKLMLYGLMLMGFLLYRPSGILGKGA